MFKEETEFQMAKSKWQISNVWRCAHIIKRAPINICHLKFAFCLLPFCFPAVFASTAQLKEGNRQFWRGSYEEALKSYNEALIDAPQSSALHFNAGAAMYPMGQFEKAE